MQGPQTNSQVLCRSTVKVVFCFEIRTGWEMIGLVRGERVEMIDAVFVINSHVLFTLWAEGLRAFRLPRCFQEVGP